jgi:phosphoribosylformylglycinamidine cyclo-ligase
MGVAPMRSEPKMNYRDTGVLDNQELGLEALLKQVRPTEQFRRGKAAGRSVLDIGYFANVVEFAPGIGLALTTDGVGTKVLIAEMLGKYDTIGIDCVAMNVNDLICVGAEPVSMLDYIAVAKAEPRLLESIGVGLQEGARRAEINIVGGEISQIKEIIRGLDDDQGIDLVGMCAGYVRLDKVNTGQDVRPGDVIVGLGSSGVHCNGLTLARRALLGSQRLQPGTQVPDLGRSVGEELLEPTTIYVRPILELLRKPLPIKAMINITSDAFLNLARIKPSVGFRLSTLPEPQPVFQLIQKMGNLEEEEMYRVFNMGVGFCLIAPPDSAVTDAIHDVAKRNGLKSYILGEVIEDDRRSVYLPEKGLVGRGERFYKINSI